LQVPVAGHLVLASVLLLRPELVAPLLDAVRRARAASGPRADSPERGTCRRRCGAVVPEPVVSHGGSGSPTVTIAHGLPSPLLSLGADQPHDASRATDLGVGALTDEMRALPGPSAVVEALEATVG